MGVRTLNVRLSAAAMAWAAGSAAAMAQCPPTFTMNAVGMGGSPIQTVVGDFNHDGKLDLASPNFSGANITLRFADPNSPAGTNFNNPLVTLPVGLNPSSMIAQDLNADGVTDLAVGYINGGAPRVGVFISNGDGTFQPIANYAPSPLTTQIKSADINHDGIADIVALASNNVLVLPGHAGAWTGGGAAAFSVRPVTAAASSNFNLIDTNGDGALDLITCQSDPGRVILSLGSPPASATFGAATPYGSGFFGTGSPAAGDFNRDGIQDVVVGHEITNSRIQVFLGSADGTLTPLPAVFPGNAAPKSLVVADFNGDGLLDVACVHNGGVGVHLGDGAGGLSSSTNFTVAQATSLATADVNNDGRPDLVAGSQSLGTFTVMLNTTPVTAFQTTPVAARVCPNGFAQFNAAATTTQTGGITGYQWQRLVSGTWTNLTNGALAGVGTITATNGAGNASTSLTVGGVQGNPGDTVMTVRVLAINSCGSTPSAPVTLSIIRPCGGADIGATGGVYTGCGDGVLDNNDFVVFIDKFFNGDSVADVGRTGGLPGADGHFDNNDFVVFIDMFFGGCTI